jgi:hypothetical protein
MRCVLSTCNSTGADTLPGDRHLPVGVNRKGIMVWTLLTLVLGGALDRALLHLEKRGWINYRRNGFSRGAAAYHALELQTIFDPGTQQVIEIGYEQRQQEDESGDPPVKEGEEPQPSVGLDAAAPTPSAGTERVTPPRIISR